MSRSLPGERSCHATPSSPVRDRERPARTGRRRREDEKDGQADDYEGIGRMGRRTTTTTDSKKTGSIAGRLPRGDASPVHGTAQGDAAASAIEEHSPGEPRSPYRGYLLGIALAVAVAVVPVIALLWGSGGFVLGEWALYRENLGEIFAAIFGLSLTVVAIVVQLAAQRYSPQIVLYFVKDPVNIAYFVFIVFSSVFVILLPGVAPDQPGARAMSVTGVLLVFAAFGTLIPYFVYVFISVQPDMLVAKIARSTTTTLRRSARKNSPARRVDQTQHEALEGLHRLTDIGVAAIKDADRDLVMRSVRALEEVLSEYQRTKSDYPARWFRPPDSLHDQFARPLLEAMRNGHTWFEAAAFFELDHMARRAAEAMPELVTRISTLARRTSELALTRRDDALLTLTGHFFNTMLRHGINARNVRVLYAILEHYRRAISGYVRREPQRAVQCCGWLVYYGQLANARSLDFVTTIIAHDMRRLCLDAYDVGAAELGDELVDLLLELDEESVEDDAAQALVGVRKAQVILAVELMLRGCYETVETIAADMRDEPRERLEAVARSLRAASNPRFWEMTDRGENFDYIEPENRPLLDEFFRLVSGQRSEGSRRP